ncbi:MAG: hypothetical protein JWQ40_3658 [Segetibacter sp.]|nr:hypothetical protein [Segetibacter sp.]
MPPKPNRHTKATMPLTKFDFIIMMFLLANRYGVQPGKALLKEEIEASIRLQPGVLNLYAVAEKDDPANKPFWNLRR